MERASEQISFHEPFGPNNSDNIGDDLHKSIYDKNNSAYLSLKTSPFLIVGRRGAGKTAILKAIKLSKRFEVVSEVPSDTSFQQIIDSIDKSSSSSTLVETVGRIWTKLLWSFVFIEIEKRFGTSDPKAAVVIRAYLKKFGPVRPSLPRAVVELIVRVLKKNSDAGRDALEALGDLLDAAGTFENAKAEAINLIQRKKVKSIVLIDNIEQVDLRDRSQSAAIAGLLWAVNTFKTREAAIEMRCCIPAEIYPRLMQICANSDKTFDSQVVLHWSSSELIRMAMIRYKEFLRTYAPSNLYRMVEDLDLDIKQDLDKFSHMFLPRTLTNGLGREEIALRYILRHTQLLPRQFISYLNAIARASFSIDPTKFSFEGKEVVKAVGEIESGICEGVFGSYAKIHEDARRACSVLLPELGLTFKRGDFERTFRENQRHLPSYASELDCLGMLTEIGAVGVHTASDEGYYCADFSYNLPLNLAIKHSDLYCIHPAFSGTFRSRISTSSYKPILPSGSDLVVD